MESDHGGPTDRGHSDDQATVIRPAKVPMPILVPRIEQPHDFTANRIFERDPAALGIIAKRTGKPEIVLLCDASEGLRNQVIELHGRTDDRFRRQAVPTAVSRLGGDPGTKRF